MQTHMPIIHKKGHFVKITVFSKKVLTNPKTYIIIFEVVISEDSRWRKL